MSSVENVTAAKPKIGGSVHVVTLGTALPEDAVSELSEEFNSLGYISEDGVKNENTPNTEQVKAWGGDVVLNAQTEKKDNLSWKLIEGLNVAVLKTVYGDKNVTGDLETGITVKAGTSELEDKSYVIDMILKDGVLKRIVIPRGSLVEVSEITYKDSEPIGYEIKIAALPDSKGFTHYEYIKKKGA